MKQPKKFTRSQKEEITKKRKDIDVNDYLLVSETNDCFVINEKGTKNILTIDR